MTTPVKHKKSTETMQQNRRALFRIDTGESLTKILARELGIGKRTKITN